MFRRIGAVVAGVAMTWILISSVERLGHMIYPPPEDLDLRDLEAARQVVEGLPVGALAFVVAAWLIGAAGGGLVACLIAKEKPFLYASIIGGLVLLGTIAALVMIPHPAWVAIAGVVGIVAVTYATAKMAAAALLAQSGGDRG